ncbi:protein AF-17 isoform X1 [Paramormyrops kingsleyae]|uniref:protein AF-17 isoform X1 n=2 Tax=Paramormyrops kingsleyae TaxID=1676925 RepID=UPI003B97BB6C
MREMVGGCCVCSDERGWAENPLVYCDGHGCSVAVHQACYGIVQVPTGPWFCRKCESQERAARVRCELCPHKDGALKRTDNGGWAHVVCALYIPEVQFANVLTMEPIVLQYVPHERYNKTCYICDDHGRESKAASGACMTCNRQGCRQAFHVTCAQMAGLLCEEEGPEADNVKYCGYCKYHFSKMEKNDRTARFKKGLSLYSQKKMRPAAGNSSSSFCHTRRTSITTIPEKHGSHHHRQKRSHKEKLRQKERHKRPPPSSLNSSLSSSTGKLPSSHHGNKETGGKTKKLGNHSLHRSKKGAGSGTKSCSSSCSSSPFNTGGGSLSSAQDFLQYSSSSRLDWEREQGDEQATEETNEGNGGPWEVEEEEEDEEEEEEGEKYAKPSLLPPVLTMSDGPQNSPSYNRVESKGSSFEPKVTISTFGSIMRITSTGGLSGAAKVRKVTPGEYRPSKPNSKVHQTPSAISEEPDILEEQTMPPVSERRHGMNKKSRHGPGRPKGSRNREGREGKEHHISQSGTGYSVPPAPPCTSYPASISISTQNSFSIGSSSSLLSSGVYSSNKDPISLGGGVCSTTIASGLLSSHTSTHPYTSSSVTNTQVYTLPSSSYSLSSTRVCGSTLSAASPLSPLLSQTQSSLPEPHLEDHFVCRGSSPQESLSSQSPMSSLPLLFDQREGVDRGARGRPENVPLASSHIELLLEKHGNGEMGVNIVEMLKSLHSLQQENQRLQDQILSLTAKKERLQLLNVELAVPFPPQAHPAASSVLTTNQISFLSSPHDALNSKKSPPSKTCIMNENTLTNSEELPSGCPSRSSSSLSFQSTPPPQQSPASLSQQFVNGLGRALTGGLGSMSQAGNTTLPMVSGLMSSLTGSPQLSMNGMLGSLNGVIQSPNQNATQQPQLSVPTQQPSHQQTLSQSLQIPNSLTSSSLLSEQQKQFLLQQQHQLQQLLHSQHFTPEQQVVVYQMIQQQRRELQHFTLASSFTSSPSNPMVNQLATTSSLQGSQGNPFFNLQDNTQHKSGSGGDKGGEKN